MNTEIVGTYRGVDIVGLYEAGYSSVEIADKIGGSCMGNTVIQHLRKAGVEIRQPGRRDLESIPRGPKMDDLPPIEPRYSCGHKRTAGYSQCPTCDRCSCPPKKRKRVRKYSGLWLCRCGRQIGE